MPTAKKDVSPAPPDNNGAPLFSGIFEPPEGLVQSAIAWHKLLIAGCALLGAIAGIAYGIARPTTYEASTTLQVGQVNPNSPGFFSYVQSSSSLATAFSRSIAAAPVLRRIEKRLDLPITRASARLSSEPIPLSPAFRIIATGPTKRDAMALANVASTSVISYENRRNSANPQAKSMLSSYRNASVELAKASARVEELSAGAERSELLEAEADSSAAQIKLKAIASAYVATVGSEPPRVGLVSLVAGATAATSDRTSKIQMLAFVGLLVGLLGGCVAAVLVEMREGSRLREGQAKPSSRFT